VKQGSFRKGFTLVEVLIGFGIFVLFFGGLFSLHRMGANMFYSGSWKLNKQKEAQRFLEILKARLEMAAIPTRINPTATDDNQRVASLPAPVFLLNQATITPSGPTNIILFSVFKPDLSLAGGSQGLAFYHALSLRNTTSTPIPHGSLLLHGNTNSNSPFFVTPVNFPPDFASLGGAFGATAESFQIGPSSFSLWLTEVTQIDLSWGKADPPAEAKLINITVTMCNTRHKETTISQSIQARVDPSVEIQVRNPGQI